MHRTLKSKRIIGFLHDQASDPPYIFSTPAGPEFSPKIFDLLAERGAVIERADLAYNKFDFVENHRKGHDTDTSGDVIYCVYEEINKWLYIYETDMGWGILFSNSNLNEILSEDLINDAKVDFLESYKTRVEMAKRGYFQVEDFYHFYRISSLGAESPPSPSER